MKEIARMRNLAKRNSLSKKEVKEKSRLIAQAFTELPEFAQAKTAMFYYGIENEPETREIIEKALEMGKKVSLPVTDFEKRTMKTIEISSTNELKENKFGLVEPVGEKKVEANSLDLIVMPGVAFDREGNRIGRGKGFYDSMLRKTNTGVILIGLCFEENLEENIPSQSHDVKMNIIVTDKEVIRRES